MLEKPSSWYDTVYVPIGSGVMRYSPWTLVTSLTCLTCRTGLVTDTVTPGRIAPLSSRTWPMIADNCWAAAMFANASVTSTTTIAIDRGRRTVTDGRLIRRSFERLVPDVFLWIGKEP